jgi:hypothetical protein
MQPAIVFLVLVAWGAIALGIGYLSYLAWKEMQSLVVLGWSEGEKTYHRARKWIRKTWIVGHLMALWKRSVVADVLYDALLTANVRHILSDKEMRYAQSVIAEALDLPDLVPRKMHNAMARAYFLGTKNNPPKYEKLAGPKGKIPDGGQIGAARFDNKIINYSSALKRLREKKSA